MARAGRVWAAALAALAVAAAAVHALPAGRGEELSEGAEHTEGTELERLVSRIRRRVIDELGLSHSVVRNTTAEEMEAVMEEYRRLVAERSGPEPDTSPLEIAATSVERGWLSGGGVGSSSRRPQEVLRASFSLEAAEQPVGGAALRLWVRSGRRRRRPASLALYTVGGGRRHRLAVRPLPRAAGWVSFNVTDAARRASALRVELRCRRCGRRLSGAAPRLQLSRRRARRVRRDTADFLGQSEAVRSGSPVDCANSHDKKCCRQKMEVNFKELGGFEQIIAPASFQAYHCRGGCPASYNVANDHALLQGWIHEKHKQGVKNMPHAHAPCCAPSKLSALPIAHYDAQGKVRITYWENVVVEECRCS